MKFWLVKTEPDVYSWQKLVKEGKAMWEGVRNYQARNHLRAMKAGDRVFFYHSNIGKEIVGVAEVLKEAYPDPTARGEDWSSVDLRPLYPLKQAVTLARIKTEKKLNQMVLVKNSRLSVMPVSSAEFSYILKMGASNGI